MAHLLDNAAWFFILVNFRPYLYNKFNFMKMHNEFFESEDFQLCTVLCAMGYKLDCINKTSPRAIFVFERGEGLDEAIQMYWRGELAINPLFIFASQRQLKSRLYR